MILKINTADPKLVKVELIFGGKVVRSLTQENKFGSQVLLPMIVKILASQEVVLQDVSEIRVNTGPGSYTGLRVGASIAQALAFALNIPVNGQLNKTPQLSYT